MSLVVWLPLDGDLRNQGCSDIEVTNNGATINNSGKIGKCYYFDGNAHWLQLSKSVGNLYSRDFSWAVWLKPTDSTRSIISSEYSSSGSSNVAFELSASRGVRIYWNGSPDIYPSNSTLLQDIWTHVAITKTTGIIKTYINGELKHTYTGTLSDRTSTSYIRIGDDYRGGTSVSYMGYMNDWRLYDHCLSAAEVKEIAQGLVLHYKLDGNGFGNKNYLKAITNPGLQIQDCDYNYDINTGTYILTVTKNVGHFQQIWNTNLVTNVSEILGKQMIISCEDLYTTDSNSDIRIYLYYTPTSIPPTRVYKGQNTVIIPSNATQIGLIIRCDQKANAPVGTVATFKGIKMELGNKATNWNPALEDLAIDNTIIHDSSGYNHNGTLNGALTVSSDTAKYNTSTVFNGSSYVTIPKIFEDNVLLSEFTWTGWIKRSYTDTNEHGVYNGITYIRFRSYNNNNFLPFISWYHSTTSESTTNSWTTGSSLPENTWTHIAFTFKNGILKYYCNGNYISTSDRSNTGQYIKTNYGTTLGSYGTSNYWIGNLSDVRVYTTQLLDTDIKMLYNISMRINNSQGTHSFEFDENQPNLMWRPENARAAGLGINWAEGLDAYTQSNCQVTCDKNGYRIYRPPNLTVSSNGNTMWGGLKVRNSTNNTIHTYNASTDNIFGLIKGHTYIFIITVEGKSSNNFSSYGITNNMGWGGHGLSPNPSNVTYKLIGTNFNGKTECYYKFTISDDIVKTCTSTYSSFTNGNQYLSYMDFMFGFGYESTGSLGTDLYISNIRLFDLTNKTSKNIQKSGIIEFTQFIEKEENITKIRNDEELYATEFIEI